MRGVLLRQTTARLVDVTHDLPRQDVRAAAFWLRETLPWFPPAVHLAVVDPGVGTERAALVVRAGDHHLVGPDNGTLLPAARRLADGGPPDPALYRRARDDADDATAAGDPDVEVFRLADADARSSTFHGRDVFAPAAALVHDEGVETLRAAGLCEPVAEYEDLRLPAASVEGDRARGEVLVVDGFGNLITNVPGSFLADADRVVVRGEGATGAHTVPVVEAFARVPAGDRLATVGSHGNVELDVNRGRGDDAFDLAAGDRVTLELADDGGD